MTAPPCTSLRELEHASLQLERVVALQDPDYLKWLFMLVGPGFSLSGAATMTTRPNWARRLPLTKL